MPFHLRDHGERSGATSVSTRVMHAGAESRYNPRAERGEFDAWARIRTWEPLREGILSPSPLTGLGYPRAAAQRPRSVKPFASRSRADASSEPFSCGPASRPQGRRAWCNTSPRRSSTKSRVASTWIRSGGRRPRQSPRRSSSPAPIAMPRFSLTFRAGRWRSSRSRPMSPPTSNLKGPTTRGRNSGKVSGTSKGSCWAGRSDSGARCRRSWPLWVRWAASPSSRSRFRRSSSGRPKCNDGQEKAADLEDAEQEGGPHKEHGPGLRSDERDVVGAGDEEVADHSIDERGAHQNCEQSGRERRIKAQDGQGHEGPDQDDAHDEDEVDPHRDDLEGEVSGGVHERHDAMRKDESDQIPIETLHDSDPPARKSFGLPCGRDLLHAFHVGRKGRLPPEIPPESRVRRRERRAQDPGSVPSQE